MENLINEPALAYPSHYSLEEYLNMQWENGIKYEFWHGELVTMAGTTLNHNKIVGNLYSSIKSAAKGKGCGTFILDILLGIKKRNNYFLPDLVYTCNENDLDSERFIFNPTIIVEVLSDSTELYDRTKKWEQYRRIPSLRYYLLVSQKEFLVELYHRPNDHTLFSYQSFDPLDAIIPFTELGFDINLSDIYDEIDLEKNEAIEKANE
jgi:Uma2 family endonuclease